MDPFQFLFDNRIRISGRPGFCQKTDVFNITDIHWALVFISLLWYVFGAQDKYLVDNYRDQIEDAFKRLKEKPDNVVTAVPGDIPYVGQVR